LENFKDDDWQFRNEIAKAGYKRYTKIDNEMMLLLVEAQLSDEIILQKHGFTDFERLYILE
jgi:hypothetical protein